MAHYTRRYSMSAEKLTPESCFQLTTKVDCIYNDSTLFMENDWMIFGLPRVDPRWNSKDVVVYYREQGDFAESTACGLKIEDEMIFFDKNCKIREEFFERLRNGETSHLASWIKSDRRLYPTPRESGDQIVWIATLEGTMYWMTGGHHRILHNMIREYVLDCDIIAAGRVWHSPNNIIWESDLLKKRTDEALRPTLEPVLLRLK